MIQGLNYPDDLSPVDLCHMEGHDYGDYDRRGTRHKPVSTCQRCGYQNRSLRAFIGHVTRKARQWDCSWLDAEDRLAEEAEAA